VANEQDMRKYGGLLNFLPITYTLMGIGSLSLIGFPFLAGFYSKDSIFEFLQEVRYINPWFFYFFGALTAMFTAFYSFRLVFLSFIVSPRGSKNIYSIYSNELTLAYKQDLLFQNYVLYFLAFAAIFAGFFFKRFYYRYRY